MTISLRVAMVSGLGAAAAVAGTRSGQASAEWLTASTTYEAGKPVRTVVRLVMDRGWHAYWENPGEAGMKVAAKWELPPGWTAGKLEFPAPTKFVAGDLVGFGYTGTVDFPVTFTPSANASGPVTVRGGVSWLTCDDQACIPGDVKLELKLEAGPIALTDDVKAVETAAKKVPQSEPGAALVVKQTGKSLELVVTGSSLDLSRYDVFPATEAAIDPKVDVRFEKSGEAWKATVPLSEYATEPLPSLTLVLVGKGGETPQTLTWSVEKSH